MGWRLRPRQQRAVAALACCAILVGCGAHAPSGQGASPQPQSAPGAPSATTVAPAAGPADDRDLAVTALGDSVPSGYACGCLPFPQASAYALTIPGLRTVTATNDATAGSTTADVLAQLSSDERVIADVRRSDVVEIEVGANDVAYSDSCGPDAACYAPALALVDEHLTSIVRRVQQLTSGRALVVLLDYWNVWLGGRYALAQGPAYVASSATLTGQVASAIKSTAGSTGAQYLDLRALFKGADYDNDETDYLAGDGDHPNAVGHRLIAAAVSDIIGSMLHL